MPDIDVELTKRLGEREAALTRIDAEVARLDMERREPDPWERTCFIDAFQALFSGLYTVAAAAMDDARLDSGKRSSSSTIPTGDVYDKADMAFIKHTLRVSRGEPVRRYPFGPAGD